MTGDLTGYIRQKKTGRCDSAAPFFLYVMINISMVLGLIPVVGIPLPLISYGGTVILSVMAGFGIILSVNVNRNVNIGKD